MLRIVEKRRGSLPPGELISADWLRAWLSGDLAAEYQVMRRGYESAPSYYAYALAVTARRTNRPREVLSAARLRDTLTTWGREWSSWYSVQASALHGLGEFRKELEVALERRRRFPLEMFGLNLEIQARAAMGQTDEAMRLIDEAATKPDGQSAAGLAYQELLAHGHDEAARNLLPKVTQVYHSYATQSRASRQDSIGYATVVFWSRDAQRSRDWWQRMATTRDTGQLAQAQRNLTYIAAREGDRERALRESEQWTVNPPPFSPGVVSYRRAQVAALLGERSRAVELLRQAFAEGYPFGMGIHRDILLQSIWNDPAFRELLRPRD